MEMLAWLVMMAMLAMVVVMMMVVVVGYWRSAMTQRYSSLVQIDIQPAVKTDL